MHTTMIAMTVGFFILIPPLWKNQTRFLARTRDNDFRPDAFIVAIHADRPCASLLQEREFP
jgi:hypothetical protein